MADNPYYALKNRIESFRCKTCRGLGTCDDADPGDIMFNTWTCRTCNGSGFDPKAMESLKEKLLELEMPTTTTNSKENLAFVFDFAGIHVDDGAKKIVDWFLTPEKADAGRT